MNSPHPAPRRSYSGPQTNTSAPPRRALAPEDDVPILAGYTYQPGRATPAPDPEAWRSIEQPTAPPASIQAYRPQRHIGWIIAIVLVVVAAIIGGVLINNLGPTPNGSTSQAAPAARATPTRTGGIAFESGDVAGYWKITDAQWGADGVRLNLEVTVDKGTLYYDFYGYANSDKTQINPVWTNRQSDFLPGFIGPGETRTGIVTFQVNRQPMTLIMLSNQQVQLSALNVPN